MTSFMRAAVIALEFVWHVQIGCLFILSVTVPKVHPLERRRLGTEMFLHVAAEAAIHPPGHELQPVVENKNLNLERCHRQVGMSLLWPKNETEAYQEG